MQSTLFSAWLRRWLSLPLMLGFIAGGAGLVIGSQLAPVYRATATLMIRPGSGVAQPADFLTLDQLARTYAQLITRRSLLEQVISDLGLTTTAPQLAREISIIPERDTALLDVQVDDANPTQAAAIANALVKDFIAQDQQEQAAAVDANLQGLQARIDELQQQIANSAQSIARLQSQPNPTTDQRAQLSLLQQTQAAQSATYSGLVRDYEDARTAQLRQYDNVAMVDPAVEPTRGFMPSASFDGLLAAIAGILAGVGLAMLAQRFDSSFRSPDDVRRALPVPLLGSIPLLAGRRQPALVVLRQPPIVAGEAFRVLRNSVLFAAGDARTLAVTSALAGEGKTRTAANLAVVLAQAGHDCVLVDADLRRPALHRLFQVADRPGLSDMLVAGGFEPGLVQPTAVPGLGLVTSGAPVENPSELLGSSTFKHIIDRLTAEAGFVVLDTAPVNGVADASVVAGKVSMTLLVINAGRTPQAAVDDALVALQRVGASVVGAVLNRSTGRSEAYYDQMARQAPIPLRLHKERAA